MSIKRKSLVTRILILFIIFNMISIFVFTFYIFQQDRYRMAKTVKDTIRKIALEKAEIISLTMNYVASETENLAMWTMELIATEQNDQLSADYARNEDGVLFRKPLLGAESKKNSSIFFPANVELTESRIKNINATERLEPIFRAMDRRIGFGGWLYVALEDGLLRVFPYSGVEMYDPHHQQKGDPFYVVANKENNPGKDTVWTKPYVDYLGTGWMITCSSPLYRGDEFLGVACVDVSLETLKDIFLADFHLSNSGFAYLLDRTGEIIYHPKFLPQGNKQGQMFLTNIITDVEISDSYIRALSKMLSSDEEGIVSYIGFDERKNKLIAYAPIDEQDWILAVEIDYGDFMADTSIDASGVVTYILIASVALLLFSVFLYQQYTKPIRILRDRAKSIAEGNYEYYNSPSDLMEIKALSDAFNGMTKEIKEYTENLIRNNKIIESVFNNIDGLLMIIDTQYNIIIINEKGRNKLEKEAKDVIGTKCYKMLLDREAPCKGCKMQDVFYKKSPLYTTMVISNEIINNAYYPILDDSKEVVEVVVHSRRNTKNVLMERELLQKEKLAGIGQVSSAIAHELKTPLAVIRGAAYLMDVYTSSYNDSRIKETISTISSVVESAEKTIYNLLDFSSPAKETVEEIDIVKLINQILLLSNKERIQKDIRTNICVNPEPLYYYGQAEYLKTILQNVISNAINAMSEDGKLDIKGGYTESNELQITVTDNGCGIPEEMYNNIFKPFSTSDTTGKGTGLGLWITKMMIDRMKGKLTIKSTKEIGTEFTITIPVIKESGENDELH